MILGTLRIKLPDGQVRNFTVEQATLGIGRAADNEISLEEISLSRRHARFAFEAGRMSVEDLGSANGTYIGSQRIAPNTPTLVPDNEVVRAGDVEVRFTAAQAPRPPLGSSQATVSEPIPGEGGMRYGMLHIRLPSGETRNFPMEQPSITVGRAADNQLSLDEISVSRRHARLTVESTRLMIEDLGSANGTFIGSQRVAPNNPGLVPADTAVRLGDVEIKFVPPAPVEAARAFAPTAAEGQASVAQNAPSGPPVNVALVGPAGPVAPGSVMTATITIQNRGAVVDEFVIRVAGVPANWVRLSKERVPLLPNAQEAVTLTFQPPRRAEAVATDHRFTVSVISREHHTGVNVVGTLRVLPYSGFTLALQPVRSARDFMLVAQNQGNAPVTYQLSGVDDERGLDYRFSQPLVTLQPGETANIPLEITPKVRPSIGARETRSFNIVGTATDQSGAAEVRAPGQLIIRPPIPIWLIPLLVLVSLCCCIGSAYAYFTFCPTYAPDMPFCPASAKPVFNFFTATPEEIEKGGAVVIAWDVANAEEVSLIAPVQSSLPPSGLQTFNLDTTTTFTIRATNFAGSVDQSITVNVRQAPPVIQSFSVTPGILTAGQSGKVVLSWAVAGATSISIEGVPGQNLAPSGSLEIDAPTQNTTYNLVATNDSGTVQQSASVVIASAECTVQNVAAGDTLYLREGPGQFYALVVALSNGTVVVPFGRNPTGDWLKVIARDASREGWVPSNNITCTNAPDISAYPTVAPDLIPTLAPSATPSPTPTTPPTGTPEPTATPSNTPTATPTVTPVFVSSGLITYRVQEGGRTTIYLQGANGGRTPLVFDKDDAEVLDYTPQNGGRFAIWVLEGGQQKVFIIGQGGNLIGSPITGAWTSVTDGDWSNDGQRLVIEVLTGSAVSYLYYDANGNATGAPAFP
jgi:pSer/pThr/pTyr-binding forkhead associated (FHA) protein